MMAAVGPEVTEFSFLLPGPISVVLLFLLLSIFLTALCSDCKRQSFELQDPNADKNPPNLISVVSLEDALEVRENPAIDEIQKDEVNPVSVTNWSGHWGAPQNPQQNFPAVQANGGVEAMKTPDEAEPPSDSEEEVAMELTPWRSHLRAPQNHDSAHIYQIIEREKNGSGGGDGDEQSAPTNQQPEEDGAHVAQATDRNDMYARVSKKVRPIASPVRTPEAGQEGEEEESPPLPHREAVLEG
ncbi:uncharacterized protein si:ch73-204p21.2 [Antennarius striatus]|uniref:uncharacterized protein si:ch73-204p21.2 n=1 Tax=Antennarius striatus TaxID=241820 RepID=UPI0035AFA2D3